MDELTFHLQSVVKTRDAQEDFNGPLSLILQLLSKNKVEIQDIRISDILDQYLEYLAGMERMDLEIAGEFITMASYLLYIKAKTLLEGTQEVEEMDTLISSLEEQRRKEILARMKTAAQWLEEQSRKGEGIFVRSQEPISGPPEYRYSHKPEELAAALLEAVGREREELPTVRRVAMPARLVYPIGEKSEEILLRLRDRGSCRLSTLFTESRSRSELAAALMAVLELYRSERIAFRDSEGGIELVQYEEE